MTAPEIEPPSTLPRYSPRDIRRYLRAYGDYRATQDGVRAITYDERVRGGEPDPWRATHIVSDIDRALLHLSQMDGDPIAASLIRSHYLRHLTLADLADQYRTSQRWVCVLILRGIHAMSDDLGGIDTS